MDGSVDAYNRLVLANQTSVYNTALRIMNDAALADDMAQTAFINAWKHIDSFNGGRFKPWLLRITINACYDELRRVRRRPSVPLEPSSPDTEDENEDMPWMIDQSPQPREMAENNDRIEAVKDCLSQLPEEYRVVMVLIDVQEEDYQTAAEILSKPLGTIKSRLMRARLRMRDCLKAKGNF